MKILEVSEETYEQIKDQLLEKEKVEIETYDDLIGGNYFFRTVTYHMLGKVVKRVGDFLELEQASWIANSGRFMQFIKDGEVEEVEPVGSVFVNIKAVVDFFPWKHELYQDQK